MKKMEGRAFICLLLVLVLFLGLGFFTYRYVTCGSDWASFYANQHVFKDGILKVGAIYDRNNVLLLKNDEDGAHYSDDAEIRKATLHVLGDRGYNISTGANVAFRDRIIGYNLVTGTNGVLTDKRRMNLTIDSELNRTAYEALAGRNGFVSVYNWRTGEILCLVSSPSIDPSNVPDPVPDGTFINKALSGTFTPGSTFKLVTTAAAIEELEGLDGWSFTCTGSYDINGETVTCPHVHGTQDFYGALANSCNCAFAELTLKIGPKKMKKYVDKFGLTASYDIDGIQTKKGSFNFDTEDLNLGWAGVGQFEDEVNPIAMMVYVGAIAGDGTAAKPVLVKNLSIPLPDKEEAAGGTVELLGKGTARQLQDMMRNNVLVTYGDSNYPGLELHAKSGTAETSSSSVPHAWFTGYSGDYAFVVCVENGGGGSSVAGPVANMVMQHVIIAE